MAFYSIKCLIFLSFIIIASLKIFDKEEDEKEMLIEIKKDINDTINVPNIKAFQKNVKLTLNDRIGTNEINKE